MRYFKKDATLNIADINDHIQSATNAVKKNNMQVENVKDIKDNYKRILKKNKKGLNL